jgi:hydrogenase/urease accessory protein HupE
LLAAAWAGAANAHALQPGYLELRALGSDTWRAYWKTPAVSGQPMQIEAVLPENCEPRRPGELRYNGKAFVTEWAATCSGGLAGGEIFIDGLAATRTDVLVRYELAPGEAGQTARLTANEAGFVVPERAGAWQTFLEYIRLGIDHILGGWDHLLFVFALMLLIPDRRRLVGAITAFTVAHSISLAAAALGWVVFPVPPVEAVIALSIMFLASELAKSSGTGERLTERYPWTVAFGFGLLHGLGFARALLDIGLPQMDVPLALLAFNVGVEVGQLMFIAVVLALSWLIAWAYPRFKTWFLPGSRGIHMASYAIGGISAYWLMQRLSGF